MRTPSNLSIFNGVKWGQFHILHFDLPTTPARPLPSAIWTSETRSSRSLPILATGISWVLWGQVY